MGTLKLFGKRIKELRKLHNMTQEELAEKIGLYTKQIGNIETGVCFTPIATIEKLAQIFDVEIKDLFDFYHKNDRQIILKQLTRLINSVPDEKLGLIYKIVKNIAN